MSLCPVPLAPSHAPNRTPQPSTGSRPGPLETSGGATCQDRWPRVPVPGAAARLPEPPSHPALETHSPACRLHSSATACTAQRPARGCSPTPRAGWAFPGSEPAWTLSTEGSPPWGARRAPRSSPELGPARSRALWGRVRESGSRTQAGARGVTGAVLGAPSLAQSDAGLFPSEAACCQAKGSGPGQGPPESHALSSPGPSSSSTVPKPGRPEEQGRQRQGAGRQRAEGLCNGTCGPAGEAESAQRCSDGGPAVTLYAKVAQLMQPRGPAHPAAGPAHSRRPRPPGRRPPGKALQARRPGPKAPSGPPRFRLGPGGGESRLRRGPL